MTMKTEDTKPKRKSLSLTAMFLIGAILYFSGNYIMNNQSSIIGSAIVIFGFVILLIWLINGISYLINKNKQPK